MKSIYELQMHEVTIVEGDPWSPLFTTAMKVPGGWIYRSYDKGNQIMSCAFVPFDNEYQNASPNPTDIKEGK